MADISYSRATRDEKDYETQAQYRNGVTDTVTFNIPEASQPSFTVASAYTDPALVTVGPPPRGASAEARLSRPMTIRITGYVY